MNDYLVYLLEVNGCFSALYLLFYVFFRSLTFHKSNRMVLLVLLPLSFALPKWETLFPAEKIVESFNLAASPDWTFNLEKGTPIIAQLEAGFPYLDLFFYLYWIGFSFCLFRLLLGAIKLFLLKRKSIPLELNGQRVYQAEVSNIFTCFQWIFIPRHQTTTYAAPILAHEKAHVQLGHTFDLLFLECFLVVCWFNPLVYLFRRSLRSVHEFQADQEVLRHAIKKSQYLELLLYHMTPKQSSPLYSYFNHPILKKRVEMITKRNSSFPSALRYALFCPLLLLLLMAFTSPIHHPILPLDQEYADASTLTNPPSLFPIANVSLKDISAGFGQRKNPFTKKMQHHNGVDIKASTGTPVIATADGTVSTARLKGNWGNLIVINHADGYTTWYAHLDGIQVSEGQSVQAGEVIGSVGNTGLSTAPHLHYELRKNDQHLDPIDYFQQ